MDDVKQYTTQWLNTVEVGHGNIGAGLDWQKQKTRAGTGYLEKGYEQRNTGVFLSAMQQFNSVTLEAAARNDDNSNFGNHATGRPAPHGSSSRGIASSVLTVQRIKHRP